MSGYFVIDTTGRVDPATLIPGGPDSTLFATVLDRGRPLRFTPPLHQAGCPVRQRSGLSVTITPPK